jgi:hypothetical protein
MDIEANSTAGKGPDDFYVVTRPQTFRAPFRSANHGAVHGYSEKTCGRVDATGREKLTHGHHRNFFLHPIYF